MRIIGGFLKRREIVVPPGRIVRPTTDRTREAIFNLVEHRIDLEESDVLDLFAGSGSLGFEAVSRGARSVVLVERERQAVRCLRDNARKLDIEDACSIVQADAGHWLDRFGGPGFDLILADPPYDYPDLTALPARAIRHLHGDGLLVLEHDLRVSFDASSHLILSRAYGRTTVSVFGSPGTGDQEPE
jgi:16S rRNA (guanine(966)-N(2))-methyltransferase RsmD